MGIRGREIEYRSQLYQMCDLEQVTLGLEAWIWSFVIFTKDLMFLFISNVSSL